MYIYSLCNIIGKSIDVILTMHNFRLPQRCKWDMRFFGCYVAWNGSFVPTFLDNLSVPPSKVKLDPRIWKR